MIVAFLLLALSLPPFHIHAVPPCHHPSTSSSHLSPLFAFSFSTYSRYPPPLLAPYPVPFRYSHLRSLLSFYLLPNLLPLHFLTFSLDPSLLSLLCSFAQCRFVNRANYAVNTLYPAISNTYIPHASVHRLYFLLKCERKQEQYRQLVILLLTVVSPSAINIPYPDPSSSFFFLLPILASICKIYSKQCIYNRGFS